MSTLKPTLPPQIYMDVTEEGKKTHIVFKTSENSGNSKTR